MAPLNGTEAETSIWGKLISNFSKLLIFGPFGGCSAALSAQQRRSVPSIKVSRPSQIQVRHMRSVGPLEARIESKSDEFWPKSNLAVPWFPDGCRVVVLWGGCVWLGGVALTTPVGWTPPRSGCAQHSCASPAGTNRAPPRHCRRPPRSAQSRARSGPPF